MNVALYEITTPIAVLLVTTYGSASMRGKCHTLYGWLMNCACVADIDTIVHV